MDKDKEHSCRITKTKSAARFCLITHGVKKVFIGKLGLKIMQKYDDLQIDVECLDDVKVEVLKKLLLSCKI